MSWFDLGMTERFQTWGMSYEWAWFSATLAGIS
jgi:hypothetical protein